MTPEERVEKRWEGDSPRMWWNRKTPEGSLMTVQVPERFPRGIFKHFFHLTNGVDAEHSGWYDNLEWTLDDFREALEDVGFAHIELIELPSGDLEGVATK